MCSLCWDLMCFAKTLKPPSRFSLVLEPDLLKCSAASKPPQANAALSLAGHSHGGSGQVLLSTSAGLSVLLPPAFPKQLQLPALSPLGAALS